MTDRAAPYADTWVVVPTYNEADNVAGITSAILERLPGATVLIVDDASPDGTGTLADGMASENDHVRVQHRSRKLGLGRAYVDGFRVALGDGAQRIVQMDADWSHDPGYLPSLVDALRPSAGGDGADLVIGSRYVAGGEVRDWGFLRRLVSRGGSLFARIVLGLVPHDLTGGFKAWRRECLAVVPWDRVHSGGYVFQIETTYLASRLGARVAELPIVFTDRRVGVSKMSRRIIAEALVVVLRLRWEEMRGRGPTRSDALRPQASDVAGAADGSGG
ncbi:MAG: dolichol-phosphate mannosyltransferase [Chloroflexota bacterium]|jgi:dolichol-phosphate mannosyltransferase|nr:dolichol-phosphate mannosyltransferase [Chloroflexota bacterium]